MAQTLDIAGAGTVGMAGNRAPFGLFKNLERPVDVFRDLGPNWLASVMGTGIVANASADPVTAQFWPARSRWRPAVTRTCCGAPRSSSSACCSWPGWWSPRAPSPGW